MDKIETKRLKYQHQGRTIYEWEQTLEELHVYVRPPPGVTAKMVSCTIRPGEMTLGIKGNPPFLSERFESGVNSDESMCVLAPPWRASSGALEAPIRHSPPRVPRAGGAWRTGSCTSY